MPDNADDARFERLELKLMDLEHSLQMLDDICLKQTRELQALRSQVDTLETRLSSGGGDESVSEVEQPTLQHEPPPHY